jgi:hypothetical protein
VQFGAKSPLLGKEENRTKEKITPQKEFNKLFRDLISINGISENLYLNKFTEFKTPLNFSKQTISKFKINFSCTQQEICSLVKQKIFKSDIELFAYTNRNIQIFYSDRFFIYPHKQINKSYYKIKYVNMTNRSEHVQCLDYGVDELKNIPQIKRFENIIIEKLCDFEFISESREKFEKLVKSYELEIEKLNIEVDRANNDWENLIMSNTKAEEGKEVKSIIIFF